ncbi:MAG: substrate-binding domain-containing protein [Chitinophagales bacterium]
MAGIWFRRRLVLSITLIVAISGSIACKNKHEKPSSQSDNPSSGHIEIVADESFAPLLQDEITNFSQIYKDTKIDVRFLPELKMTTEFFGHENVRLMVIARRLYEDEKLYFEKMGLPPRETKIAIDAVAFIINPSNVDTQLTYEQVQGIMSGKINSWKEINAKSPLSKISLVFDNQQSSTIRFLNDKLMEGQLLTKQEFAVKSNPEVINYVENNPSSIGVVGVGWLSKTDNSMIGKFPAEIRVVAISAKAKPDTYYLPEKRFLYSLQYPFLRELFIISQEKHSGLGTGFATYVASDEGQRIVQRSGLLPIDKAVRIIELKDKF